MCASWWAAKWVVPCEDGSQAGMHDLANSLPHYQLGDEKEPLEKDQEGLNGDCLIGRLTLQTTSLCFHMLKKTSRRTCQQGGKKSDAQDASSQDHCDESQKKSKAKIKVCGVQLDEKQDLKCLGSYISADSNIKRKSPLELVSHHKYSTGCRISGDQHT